MEIDPRNGIQILDESSCWEMLAREAHGRLAVAPAGIPDIFPVNHLHHDNRLLFRTAEGSKLVSVAVNAKVAYEVDGYLPDTGEAWSVVVQGTARIVESDEESAMLEELPLTPWNAGPKNNFVEIVPERVSGRRFRLGQGPEA